MTFLICPGEMRLDKAFAFAEHLSSIGCRCLMDRTFGRDGAPASLDFLSPGEAETHCDMMISVGGDGTMLKTAQRAIRQNKPVFGLNAGRIGFLCAFDYDAFPALTLADIEGLILNERMLLEVVMDQRPDEVFLAVNDVVLNKGGLSKTVELQVRAGQSLIGDYRADGVIVATPTGSTGYSLSAGGPIIEPSIDIVLVTPICAHAMFSRSIALSGAEAIRIEPSPRSDTDIFLSADSSFTFLLTGQRGVTIRKSKKTLKLMTSPKRDYYQMINRRISKGE